MKRNVDVVDAENLPIENREIRGLTARTLAAIFGGFMMVLITVVGSYYSIMRKLDGLDPIRTDIGILQKRDDANSNDIKQLQQQTIPALDIRVTKIEEQIKDKMFIKNP